MTILSTQNYKSFLKHYISHLPKKGRGEIARISQYLGVSSTLMSQILSNEKHLSLEQAQGITQYLGLSSLEADYFLLLVHCERAGTVALKKYYEKKMEELRSQALQIANRVEPSRHLTDQERALFYSSHLFAAIWLFTSTSEKGKSIDDICVRFDLSRSKAADIVKFLHETNLCTEKNGLYQMGTQSTHVEQGSPHLLHHYRNWRIQAVSNSENLTPRELMYTAAVSLSEKDFDILREAMAIFIKDFLKRTHASPAENIACFNLDFFWIKK